MESRIILHVDMDYFYAQCEERENPELKGKAVVVCMFSRRGHDSGAIATCNYKAREYGIRAGMPIARAKKLCPDAAFLPANFELYTRVSDGVMNIIRGFSNKFEQAGIDEAFADVTQKAEGEFDKAEGLALELKGEVLEKEKLTCSVGIANNKSIAKIASDFK
ncbi:DNA polymerase IV, partial [Candidatus Micrarchaeota archaeon]|nr:DNA polymerase IV [Candidatus Micrarchaeota archaeon]